MVTVRSRVSNRGLKGPSFKIAGIKMPTILLVDDDAYVRDAVEEFLRTRGHEVLAYADAAPALESVDFENVDLILTDLKMPTSGDQFVLLLEQKKVDVPVIVISGFLDEEHIIHLSELGVRKTLSKPVRLAELLHEVDAILNTED